MTDLLIAGRFTPTNVALERACAALGIGARLMPAEVAARRARCGQSVLGRVDVLPSLDGTERGLGALARLQEEGLLVLNCPASLHVAHDKLETADALQGAGIPHPQTTHVTAGIDEVVDLDPPYVVKPRFGSWGKEVTRCDSRAALTDTISSLRGRAWFEKHGALVQECVPNPGVDLRVVVSGGIVVGAIARVAAAGEWRTNVSLGGTRTRIEPDAEAAALAVAAVAAVGGDLMGVDLLATPEGYVVLEVNGAVDFTHDYSLASGDVFREAILGLVVAGVDSASGVTAPAVARLDVN
jgi:RimK family alpha-L-glutamate ligase